MNIVTGPAYGHDWTLNIHRLREEYRQRPFGRLILNVLSNTGNNADPRIDVP